MLAVSTGQDITEILAWILAYLIMITIFIFIIHLVIAFLIYRDAKEHNLSAIGWTIVVLILPLVFAMLGLIVYVIAVLVVAVAYTIARSRKHGFHHKEKGNWKNL